MKFSILSIISATAFIALGIALYAEHARNAERESTIRAKHREELENLRNGLTVFYSIEHLLQNYHDLKQPKNIQRDLDFSALVHVVNSLDFAEFLDRDPDLYAEYGENASLKLATTLLTELQCKSADDFFVRFRQKMKMLDMEDEEEYFRLGIENSARRIHLTEFINLALEKQEGTTINK
ncbi:hypothetical protein OAU26_07405 [Mariniblastus sp.]|nr:hypothetical protein [Mariniblastus sp.]